ncbi:hypothetical protein T484DRAFT_1818089 [Baffinella frigidus]|nr:hypothetical protein T484DRAFT_1818089 [Cryptophyta sp. CCMP2293]
MPGADGESAVAPAAAFKKSERRGNFRKKDKQATEEAEDGLSVSEMIEQTRNEQKLRERTTGVGAEKLATADKSLEKKEVVVEGDTGGSTLDSQFSSGMAVHPCPYRYY